MTSAHAASTHTRAASILSSVLLMASSVCASAARSDQECQGGLMGKSKRRLLIFAAGYSPTPILSPPHYPAVRYTITKTLRRITAVTQLARVNRARTQG